MVVRNIERLPLDVFYVLTFIDTYYIDIRDQIGNDLKSYNTRACEEKKPRFRYGNLTRLTMVLLRFCFKTKMTEDWRECCAEIMKVLGLDMTGDKFKEFFENRSRKKSRDIDIFDLAKKSRVHLKKTTKVGAYRLAFPPEILSLLQIFTKYLSDENTMPSVVYNKGNEVWLMRQCDTMEESPSPPPFSQYENGIIVST